SIETGGHRRGIRGAKESTNDIEGDATSLAEGGFLKFARIGANDRGTNGDNVQGEWPARHIDGRIAGGHLQGVVTGGLQILRIQADARTNRGRSRSGGKDYRSEERRVGKGCRSRWVGYR